MSGCSRALDLKSALLIVTQVVGAFGLGWVPKASCWILHVPQESPQEIQQMRGLGGQGRAAIEAAVVLQEAICSQAFGAP